jgi:hypothetical protein
VAALLCWRLISSRREERSGVTSSTCWGCWILGVVMIYSALFGVGKILLHHLPLGLVLVALSALCAWRMHQELTTGQGSAAS